MGVSAGRRATVDRIDEQRAERETEPGGDAQSTADRGRPGDRGGQCRRGDRSHGDREVLVVTESGQGVRAERGEDGDTTDPPTGARDALGRERHPDQHEQREGDVERVDASCVEPDTCDQGDERRQPDDDDHDPVGAPRRAGTREQSLRDPLQHQHCHADEREHEQRGVDRGGQGQSCHPGQGRRVHGRERVQGSAEMKGFKLGGRGSEVGRRGRVETGVMVSTSHARQHGDLA